MNKSHRWLGAVVGLALAGCPAEAPSAPPPLLGATVDLGRLMTSAPSQGKIRVSGAAGTVVGSDITTVTLTVLREGGIPAAMRLQHLGGGLPVASTFATIKADGSFAEVEVGDPERPVQSGDELNITPQAGIGQAGPTVSRVVP